MSIQNIGWDSGQVLPLEAGHSSNAAPAKPALAPKPELQLDALRQLAADMEKFVREAGRNLQFQVDSGSGQMVIKVVDADSGDVIRQIPSEEFVRRAQWLRAVDGAGVSLICDTFA